MIKNMKGKMQIFTTKPKVSLGVFLMFVAIAMFGGWFAAVRGWNERQSNLLEKYAIGDEVYTDTLTFSVEGMRRDVRGTGPLSPRPGYEFIIPTINLVNTSADYFDFIPLLYLHIKDREGNVYNVAAVPTEGSQFAGVIPPRGVLREEIGFEVARGAEGLSLYFDPGTNGQKFVIVDLEEGSWRKLFK
jgi:hypothetical protein